MGKPPIPTNTEDTEKTEGHRDGRRASARRTHNGSLEGWKLGGAPEVEARAAALGGDEAGRCAVITKSTKNHEDAQRRQHGGGRAVRARKAHVRPGAYGAWRASHATLWELVRQRRTRPGSRRCRRFKRYRSAPAGRQTTVLQSGVSRRPRGPICPIGPTASLKCVSRKRQKHKGWARQRGPQGRAATLRFPISPCRRKAPNLPRPSVNQPISRALRQSACAFVKNFPGRE